MLMKPEDVEQKVLEDTLVDVEGSFDSETNQTISDPMDLAFSKCLTSTPQGRKILDIAKDVCMQKSASLEKAAEYDQCKNAIAKLSSLDEFLPLDDAYNEWVEQVRKALTSMKRVIVSKTLDATVQQELWHEYASKMMGCIASHQRALTCHVIGEIGKRKQANNTDQETELGLQCIQTLASNILMEALRWSLR